MFAIVGHDEKEQEELARDLFGKIMAQAILTVMGELPKEKQDALLPLFSSGEKPHEILESLRSHTSNEVIEKHIAAASFTIVRTYMTSIENALNETQKKALSELFFSSVT